MTTAYTLKIEAAPGQSKALEGVVSHLLEGASLQWVGADLFATFEGESDYTAETRALVVVNRLRTDLPEEIRRARLRRGSRTNLFAPFVTLDA